MIYAKLYFTKENVAEDDLELVSDYIENLLACLPGSGQIIDYFPFELLSRNKTTINVVVPERSSLLAKHDNHYVAEWKRRLADLGVKISYKTFNKIDGSDSGIKSPKIEELILYQSASYPLRSMKDFEAIPLYHIDYTSNDKLGYENIKHWQRNFEDCYSLWFRGQINEADLYKELSGFDSSLSKQGMELCSIISNITKHACYYYLFRQNDEHLPESKCPSCGSEWLLSEKILDRFDYKCDQCKVIS